jgi:hypothetical protein
VDVCLELPGKDWNAHFVKAEKKLRLEQILGKAAKLAKRQKDTQPSRDLKEYAGAFTNPAYGTVQVTTQDKALRVEWSSFKLALEHWHFDTFKVAEPQPLVDDYLVFTLNADGAVTGLRWFGQEFTRGKAAGK